MASQLVQMVTVVDKSGKAVNSSKHMASVWKEAKAAYKERKAEKQAELQGRRPQSSRRQHSSSSDDSDYHRRRRHLDRPRSRHYRPSVSPRTSYNSSSHPSFRDGQPPLLLQGDSLEAAPVMLGAGRSRSSQDSNLQLIHAPLLPPRPRTSQGVYHEDDGNQQVMAPTEKQRLDYLVRKVRRLLEEADCLHYSATKTVAMLQKNPDTMAAVALSLAEISKIVSKMGPGVLTSLRVGAPAVFGLLVCPQFLIAGGIAVGVTVVAFGGYKVVKRIKAKKATEPEDAIELDVDLNQIREWRRGVDNDDLISNAGTSVDGELITPTAAQMSRLDLRENTPVAKSRKDKLRALLK